MAGTGAVPVVTSLSSEHDYGHATALNLGDRSFLTGAFVKPSIEEAKKYRRKQLYRGGHIRIFRCKFWDVDELGAGVGLYFRLLCYLFGFFLIALGIAAPTIAFAAAGTRYSIDEMDPLRVARLSIGNVGDRSSSQYYNVTVPYTEVTYTGREIALFWGVIDVIISAVFVLVLVVMKFHFAKVAATIDAAAVTATDYAVLVKGFPPNVTEIEIGAHFENLYNLRKRDWVYKSSCSKCFLGRKAWQRYLYIESAADPTQPKPKYFERVTASLRCDDGTCEAVENNTRNLADDDVTPVDDPEDPYNGRWVADVALARANGSLIRAYKSKASLIRSLHSARAKVLKHNATSKSNITLDKLSKLEERVGKVIKDAGAHYSNDVVAAFITFNNVESFQRCIQDYQGSDNTWNPSYWAQAQPLLFRGKPLTVVRAPDPSRIIWENLEVDPCTKRIKSAGVSLLAVFLLLISFLIIMLAQSFQVQYRATVPNTSVCQFVVPAVAFGLQVESSGQLAAGNRFGTATFHRNGSDPTCSGGASRLYWESDVSSVITNTSTTDPCYNECYRSANNAGSCTYPTTTVGKDITYTRDTVVSCYCSARLRALLFNQNVFTGIQETIDQEKDFCVSYAKNYLVYNAIIILASVVVVLINSSLGAAMTFMTSRWENHSDMDSLNRNLATRVFLGMFLNTGCLVLLINAALPAAVNNISVGSTKVFAGKYASFDVRWHAAVGASIVLTMIINSITVHFATIFKGIYSCMCRRVCNSGKATQEDLNDAYKPVDFPFAVRLAVVLNSVTTCFAYSTGHPILYIVAAFSVFLAFWVDRIAILRLYKKPLRFDEALPTFGLSMLKLALLLHLLFGIWMLSDPTTLGAYAKASTSGGVAAIITPSATSSDDAFGGYITNLVEAGNGININSRLSLENTIPLFVLLVVSVTAWLLITFSSSVYLSCKRNLCSSCGACKGEQREPKGNPTFTGSYMLPLVSGREYRLTPEQHAAGLRIMFDHHKQFMLAWVRPDNPTIPMRTWQAITLTGLPSFHMDDNPSMTDIASAVAEARKMSDGATTSIVARRKADLRTMTKMMKLYEADMLSLKNPRSLMDDIAGAAAVRVAPAPLVSIQEDDEITNVTAV